MARNKRTFDEAKYRNNATYLYYYNRLVELAISMFEWKNLPKEIDQRYLELILCTNGNAVFFKDEDLDQFLALKCVFSGKFDVYNIPMKRRAIANNGYNLDLDYTNSVVIYNNYLHHNNLNVLEMFAKRLYNLERTIDINVDAQKTPVIIQCDENQKLTLQNVYMQYNGNMPVIYGDKKLNPNDFNVLKTDAPFVAQNLYELKTQIWNEALTYLGITNLNIVKKERLVTDEVTRSQGGIISSRHSRLQSRKEAVEKINDMFGLDISVEYRQDYREMDCINVDDDTQINGGDDNE